MANLQASCRIRDCTATCVDLLRVALQADGPAIDVEVFESADLPDHRARLDDFDGDGYQRVVTRVRTPTGEMDASIYVHAQAQN